MVDLKKLIAQEWGKTTLKGNLELKFYDPSWGSHY
jgi:hypothetical protein